MATHWKCLMMSEGSVISLGIWVTMSVRATWGKRRGKGICRIDLQDGQASAGYNAATLSTQQRVGAPTATPELSQHRPPQCPIPNPEGTARQCHTPDAYRRASVSRDKTARERDLPPGCHFIQKLVKISNSFPCQPSSRLFLKTTVPTETSICAKQEVVLSTEQDRVGGGVVYHLLILSVFQVDRVVSHAKDGEDKIDEGKDAVQPQETVSGREEVRINEHCGEHVAWGPAWHLASHLWPPTQQDLPIPAVRHSPQEPEGQHPDC